MAFKTKSDYFGLGAVSGLELTASAENKSKSTAEAKGENGFVVAVEPYGETSAPSCDLVVKNSGVTLSGIVLGTITTISSDKYCLANLTINTSAGAAPTMSASGQKVEAGATANCTCTLPSISVSGLHHAQTFGAFAVGGNGAHLTSCNLQVGGTISTATKDGEVIAHDLTDVRMTISGTVQVSDAAYGTPTITPTTGAGWVITSPISETNPDSDFPSYSFTLQKTLTADTPQSNG